MFLMLHVLVCTFTVLVDVLDAWCEVCHSNEQRISVEILLKVRKFWNEMSVII